MPHKGCKHRTNEKYITIQRTRWGFGTGSRTISRPWLLSTFHPPTPSKCNFYVCPNLYRLTCSTGIRAQQAGRTSSTRRISGYVDKSLLPSARSTTFSPLPSPSPAPSTYTFSRCRHTSRTLGGPLLGVFSHALLFCPEPPPQGVLAERGGSEFTRESNGKWQVSLCGGGR